MSIKSAVAWESHQLNVHALLAVSKWINNKQDMAMVLLAQRPEEKIKSDLPVIET